MALIFLNALIVFAVKVSSFTESSCHDFITNDEWPQFTWPQSTDLSALGAMLESYHRQQPKLKTVPEF